MSNTLKQDIGLLLLRLTFGGIMLIQHGIPKISGFATYAAQFPDILGIGPKYNLILAIGAEVGCALFVILGLLTRLSTVPLIITMAVAFFIVHGADPFQKKEMALLYLMAYVVIFLLGAGRFSLDNVLPDSLKK
jgi:putative oxidoreductase